MPRLIVFAAALLACGCNEIRYQASRIDKSKFSIQKPPSLPDRRAMYACKDGEPFAVLFPPGGTGTVLELGGEELALRDLATVAGKRYGDGRYELYIEEDGSAYVTFDEKRIRVGCSKR